MRNVMKNQILLIAIMHFVLLNAVYGQAVTNFDYSDAKVQSSNELYTEFVNQNGTIIKKYSDREEARFKDGTIIIRYPDNRRSISYPDGSKLYIDYDGSRRYLYKDGRERNVSLDGKTPYGEDIERIERKIERNGKVLYVEYSASLSDEQYDGSIKDFYNDLVTALERNGDQDKLQATDVRLVVSYCRYCQTGFCKRINRRGVSVSIYKNGAKVNENTLEYALFIKSAERNNLIINIISSINSLR
jgi:hypothetical protein